MAHPSGPRPHCQKGIPLPPVDRDMCPRGGGGGGHVPAPNAIMPAGGRGGYDSDRYIFVVVGRERGSEGSEITK